MSNRIFPTIAPFIRAIFGQDDNDDFRVARVDYNGGLLAGYGGAYNAPYNEGASATSSAAGSLPLNLSTVPSNELWIVQIICVFHWVSSNRSINIFKSSGQTGYLLAKKASVAGFDGVTVNGDILMAPGEYLHFELGAQAANETFTAYTVGYKVRLK